MRRVILTVGPQCAGKSTFAQSVVRAHPDVHIVSRDAILMELCGSIYADAYSGTHEAAWDILWRKLAARLENPDVTIILDAWNGPPEERVRIAQKVREMRVDCLAAWHFVTPLDTNIAWSFDRKPIECKKPIYTAYAREQRIGTCTRIHGLFAALHLQEEGVFDVVRHINPCDPVPSDILAL